MQLIHSSFMILNILVVIISNTGDPWFKSVLLNIYTADADVSYAESLRPTYILHFYLYN